MCSIFIFLFIFSLALSSDQKISLNRFDTVVIFGDSLSDTDNTYALTNYTWPIVPPYYEGRFCNGPNWVDRLDVLEKYNYAFSGATTDNDLVQGQTKFNTVSVPGVRQQVDIYLYEAYKNNIDISLPLYIIWISANDFIFNPSLDSEEVIQSMLNAVKDLLAAGANDILIFNQIPLQAIPYSNRFNIPTLLTELTNLFNFDLRKNLKILQKNHPEASIYMFDIHSLITKIISSSSSPFINTVDKCWKIYNVTTVVELCSDPKEFAFIDNFHFSSTVHRFIADALQPLLSLNYKQDTPDRYIHSF